ncbi:unnamed protein product [Gadus morhua 'NCC']
MDRGLQEMCSQMEINMDALDQPPADEVVIIGNNWPHTAVLLLIETWRPIYSGKDIIKTIGVHNYCLVFSLMDKN